MCFGWGFYWSVEFVSECLKVLAYHSLICASIHCICYYIIKYFVQLFCWNGYFIIFKYDVSNFHIYWHHRPLSYKIKLVLIAFLFGIFPKMLMKIYFFTKKNPVHFAKYFHLFYVTYFYEGRLQTPSICLFNS